MPIEVMMSLDKYIDEVENKVIPDMRRAFPDDEEIFQQDFAPCHLSKKVKTIFRKYKLNVSERPGNSPDLNPYQLLKLKFCKIYVVLIKNDSIECILLLWSIDLYKTVISVFIFPLLDFPNPMIY